MWSLNQPSTLKHSTLKHNSKIVAASADLLFGGVFVYLIGSLCVFVLAVWLCASLIVL